MQVATMKTDDGPVSLQGLPKNKRETLILH